MSVLIVIPARYPSVRYPGKPLVPLTGASGVKRQSAQHLCNPAEVVPNLPFDPGPLRVPAIACDCQTTRRIAAGQSDAAGPTSADGRDMQDVVFVCVAGDGEAADRLAIDTYVSQAATE